MKKQMNLSMAVAFLIGFVLWTMLVRYVDVAPIGPLGSTVGFATWNGYVHELTGVHMSLYTTTDWLGLVPIGVAIGFAAEGLIQWIHRKSLAGVDRHILLLGGFYVVVAAVFLLFERVVINYRPVLIEGALEASYPSSTTMLVLCVMPTAIMRWNDRIKHCLLKRCIIVTSAVFTVLMVILRLVSGVHWVTDIIGGICVSAGLVLMYRWISCSPKEKA